MPKAPSFDRIQHEVGLKIRAVRLTVGITQEVAAAAAGIDYKRWQKLEAGEVNATIRTLVRVANALGLSFWELLAED